MWNLQNKTNEQTKLKQSHRHREGPGGCQRGGDRVKEVLALVLIRRRLDVEHWLAGFLLCSQHCPGESKAAGRAI